MALEFEPLSDEEERVARCVLVELTPHPILFSTITGTHQYGFTSPDSDVDVRGAFAMPSLDLLGLKKPTTHAGYMGVIDGREADGVAFEIGRFCELVLKGAGNVIEELFSPIVLVEGTYLEPMREVVAGCFSKQLIRHYIGFFDACIKKLYSDKKPPEIKSALYALRIALTGIKLMQEGYIQAHLPTLAAEFELDFVDEWLAMKVTEHEPIPADRFDEILERLKPWRGRLKRSPKRGVMPSEPQGISQMDQLLKEIRREHV